MSQPTPPQGLPLLMPEVISIIFSMTAQPTLLDCRLINTYLGALATAHAFRHVRLFAAEDGKRFVNIARTERLRKCVREVTCDTYVGPGYEYHSNEDFTFPWQFFASLPFVKYFGRLETLNLRFSKWCSTADNDAGELAGTDIEETPDIRYRILDTVFHCLAGTWSAERQEELDLELDLDQPDDTDSEVQLELDYYKDEYEGGVAPVHLPPSSLRLTVCNLGDFDDPRLTKSEAFRSVISSQIKELKIMFTVQECDASPESAIFRPEKYELFENLPKTWLIPPLAMNLTVLSLYCRDYFGCLPRLDFRCVNPGTGPDSGFPQLRVLALGNYIISHEWQVDWIASLGRQNGVGGLEELYLDDSPIMFKARVDRPLASGETEVTNALTGEVVQISEDMYLVPPIRPGWTPRGTPVWTEFPYSLRWHRVLARWQEAMLSLKVFRMGHGAWSYSDAVANAWQNDDSGRNKGRDELFENQGCQFIWYDRPVVDEDGLSGRENPERFKDGEGMRQERMYLCQYVHFDIGLGPTQWIEHHRDFRRWQDKEIKLSPELDPTGTLMRDDEETLASFLEAVEQRRASTTR